VSAARAAIESTRLIAIVRSPSRDDGERTLAALIAAGVRVVEVSLTTPSALELIASCARDLPPGVTLGAGTVTTGAAAEQALAAGAEFLVGPTWSADVMGVAAAAGRLYVPGAFSPAEIVAAVEHGAELVKVFPASALGPRFVRDVLAPYPGLRLVPTGGIGVEQAPEYLANGAAAVGLGGALASADPAEVRAAAERLDVVLAPYRRSSG
jgi:2-dehydro-3-deoxyphosphogluconate aldolase/(4S)-4-hydroxy-2-oxoglutarate aldolase